MHAYVTNTSTEKGQSAVAVDNFSVPTKVYVPFVFRKLDSISVREVRHTQLHRICVNRLV